MPETEYPDNSYDARRANKVAQQMNTAPAKEEPVQLRGKLVRKKKPIGLRRLREIFTGEDIRSVAASLWSDTVVPAVQDALEDALRDGIARVIRGSDAPRRESRHGGYRPNSPYTSRTDYRQYSSRRDERTRPPTGRRSRNKDALDYREIVFDNRVDGDNILYRLEDKISRFGSASLADLYRLLDADEEDIEYTDEERGWFSARGFSVAQDRDGYRLVLPRPELLS